MAEDLSDLTTLKKKVDRLKSEADQAQGALNSALATLQKDFNCSSIEEAEKLLKKLELKSEQAKADFDEALESFKKKWEGKL